MYKDTYYKYLDLQFRDRIIFAGDTFQDWIKTKSKYCVGLAKRAKLYLLLKPENSDDHVY